MVKEMTADLKEEKREASSSSGKRWTDAEWPKQWYLNRGGALDMNVEAAWDRGYSGKGVTVTILDDGVEWNHPDLSRNYREVASYDINSNDADPFPRSMLTHSQGTTSLTQTSMELDVPARWLPRETTRFVQSESPSTLALGGFECWTEQSRMQWRRDHCL